MALYEMWHFNGDKQSMDAIMFDLWKASKWCAIYMSHIGQHTLKYSIVMSLGEGMQTNLSKPEISRHVC